MRASQQTKQHHPRLWKSCGIFQNHTITRPDHGQPLQAPHPLLKSSKSSGCKVWQLDKVASKKKKVHAVAQAPGFIWYYNNPRWSPVFGYTSSPWAWNWMLNHKWHPTQGRALGRQSEKESELNAAWKADQSTPASNCYRQNALDKSMSTSFFEKGKSHLQ